MEYLTAGWKKKVSLVLLPIDGFTDQIITEPRFRVYLKESGRPSIRKDDGYHVFCGLPEGRTEICMEGPLYQSQELSLLVPSGKPKVIYVRLLPSRNYPIPKGATCVKGSLRPGGRFRLFFPDQKKSYKLSYDYNPDVQGRTLGLFLPKACRLEGKTLCIQNKEGNREFFRIISQTEDLELDRPLQRSYKKIGASVFPVQEASAGEDGMFYLPIGGFLEETVPCVCMVSEGGEEMTYSWSLVAGQENLFLPKELGSAEG